jgi:hypothetical protein
MLQKLRAFTTVSQRFQKRRSASELVAYINALYESAKGKPYSVKVPTLWKMEAAGVQLGQFPCCVSDLGVGLALPIVAVGFGAGIVSTLGFSPSGLRVFCDQWDGYPWEGCGHMLALQYHPVIAWMLGMPRPKQEYCVGDAEYADSFGPEIAQRIRFGYDRMEYLCKGVRPLLPGAKFAYAMTNYQKWCPFSTVCIRPTCRCILCNEVTLSGEREAVEFVDKIWP